MGDDMNLDDFCRVTDTQKKDDSFGSGTILLIGLIILILIFALRRRPYAYPAFFAGGYGQFNGFGASRYDAITDPGSYRCNRKHHHRHHRRDEIIAPQAGCGYGTGPGQGYGAPDGGYNFGYGGPYDGSVANAEMPNPLQQY